MHAKATHLVCFKVEGRGTRGIQLDLITALARRDPDSLYVFPSTIRVNRLVKRVRRKGKQK